MTHRNHQELQLLYYVLIHKYRVLKDRTMCIYMHSPTALPFFLPPHYLHWCVAFPCTSFLFLFSLLSKDIFMLFPYAQLFSLIPDPSDLWAGGPDNAEFCLRKNFSLANIFPFLLFSLKKRELDTNISICPGAEMENPSIWTWLPQTHKKSPLQKYSAVNSECRRY